MPDSRPFPFGSAVACGLFAGAVVAERLARGPAVGQWWAVLAVAAVLLAAVLAALWARGPLAALVLACGMTVVYAGEHPPDGTGAFLVSLGLPVVAVSYLTGRRSNAMWRPAAVFALSGVLGALLFGVRTGGGMVYLLALIGVCPWLLGRFRRQQAELVAAGWERAEQLELRQRIVAEQARVRERTRIAGEMHDSLGHELSLIALRASAMEIAPDLDELNRAAARALRLSAAQATERLHEIIGLLREDTEPAPIQPPGETVAELVERTRSSGMPVRLRHIGEPVDLPPVVERTAYRVVQESLTNATKHAPGAAVTVQFVQSDAVTVLAVRNAAPPHPPDDTAPVGSGRGLDGLRERVRMVGGTLSARARAGGFEVIATLPHAAAEGGSRS